MEGVITCGVAIFAISFIVKFPDEERSKPSWGFLNREKIDFVIERLNADRGDVEPEKFTWKKFLEPATVSPLGHDPMKFCRLTWQGLVHLRIPDHAVSCDNHCLRLCVFPSVSLSSKHPGNG